MSKLTIPRRLKELRKKAALTQVYVSEVVGISNTTLSQYESGKRLPSFETLCKLASLYSVTTDYILGATDSMAAENVITSEELHALSKLKRIDAALFSSVCNAVVLPEMERSALSNMTAVYVSHTMKS